jgi:hypothetical protein
LSCNDICGIYASGARFINLLGGEMLSFYDWYADLPPASPQICVRVNGTFDPHIIMYEALYQSLDSGTSVCSPQICTPIPAMSMISYASGARFINLLGGEMLSFYDWYDYV